MKTAFASSLLVCVAIMAGCGGKNGGVASGGGSGDDADDAGAANDAAVPAVCGNSLAEAGEACDDGNTTGGDGCSADCSAIDPGWLCAEPGIPCVHVQVCGNGILEAGETCDDHNTVGGDGCDAQCGVEPGWKCEIPGVRCIAALCGDSVIAGFEECDDGNAVPGDGCSENCKLEPGHACDVPGMPCRATVCGDRIIEGTEQCDDGNNDLGDGCDPFCHREPQCTNGTCTAVCGDGVLQVGEACDDGNLQNADGCSSTCTVETGFTCTPVVAVEPDTVSVAIVYRDIRGHDLTGGHPDFQNVTGDDRGIVAATLGADHKPVYASATTTKTTHGKDAFASWYRDDPNFNLTIVDTIPLGRTGPGTYVFDKGSFFPLDGKGFVHLGTEQTRKADDGLMHNFNFTSELRYWFDYKGGEVLSFRGDDDVWVFINGTLAIDLGGVHGAENDSITLDDAARTKFNLTIGGTYEVVVFQAERHTTASSYKLTLQGFNAARSTCTDHCGDGVTSANEQCDDGVNMGGYNLCGPGCRLGPRCGDGHLDPDHEQCDDGVNSGAYGTCTPTCTLAPRCGDGIIQSDHGEQCDDQNDNPSDGCDKCHFVIL